MKEINNPKRTTDNRDKIKARGKVAKGQSDRGKRIHFTQSARSPQRVETTDKHGWGSAGLGPIGKTGAKVQRDRGAKQKAMKNLKRTTDN